MNIVKIKDFPENKIYILLDKNYRKNLIKKSIKKLRYKTYFELSIWINKKFNVKFNGGDIKYWIKGKRLDKRTGKIHPKFMPLWLALNLLKLNNEKVENLYKNIISYRSGGKGLIIKKPILPIKITPELDSIVIHLFGDGAAGDFTPSYTQKRKEILDNFIKKLENCFGDFEKSIYHTQGKYQIKFPKAITDILSKYYLIKSYRTYEAKIPKKILNRRDKKYKVACITAFIIDEGCIRDVISIFSANKILLSGMRKLILDCRYSCSEIKSYKGANGYSLNLKNKNIEKIYQDIQELSKLFPTCNLSAKESEIKFILHRRSKKNPKNWKVTDKAILSVLKKGKFDAKKISRLTGYTHSTIINHMKKLYKDKIVKRNKIRNKTYIWDLKK